ncbi:MAG: amino acid racemase [Candidatus Aenigmarchaeota archaeon]|nr:amino acid racemase [Candidatus Aenigmarchaeota archaeon]
MTRIGMLGGIGPESTGEFYLKLIKQLQKRKLIEKNTQFPHIIINSIPAPELIFDKIKNSDLDIYFDGIKELDRLGVDFIVMICNTIHLFYNKLQKEVQTPIIDLRLEILHFLSERQIKSVTILATPSTIEHGLYKFDGISYTNPDKEELESISKAVFNFNKGIDKEQQKETLHHIAKKYIQFGSEIILLGCTEISLMLENSDLPKINTMLENTIRRLSL